MGAGWAPPPKDGQARWGWRSGMQDPPPPVSGQGAWDGMRRGEAEAGFVVLGQLGSPIG